MKMYIRCMSMDKDAAKHQIKPFSSIIMEHTIKLIMYSDIRPEEITGWIHTIANWVHKADDITVKPKARKLKEEDILNSLFSQMGDDLSDYIRALEKFQADNINGKFNSNGKGSYPLFDVNYEVAENLMNVCYALIDATMPLLIDKKDHSIQDYDKAVEKVFDSLI